MLIYKQLNVYFKDLRNVHEVYSFLLNVYFKDLRKVHIVQMVKTDNHSQLVGDVATVEEGGGEEVADLDDPIQS